MHNGIDLLSIVDPTTTTVLKGLRSWATPARITTIADANTAIDGNSYIPFIYPKDEMDPTGAKAATDAMKSGITRKNCLILNSQ